MIEQSNAIAIDTVADATRLLKKGDCLVVRCPTAQLAEHAYASIVRKLTPGGGCLLVAMQRPAENAADQHARHIILLHSVRSGTAALRVIARESRKSPARLPFLLFLRAPLPPWLGRSKALLGFCEHLVQQLKRSKRSSILILPTQSGQTGDLAWLKDSADLYLDILDIGDVVFGQFLAAKGIDEPGFFFPRRITIAGDELHLGSPMIPSVTPGSEGMILGDAVEEAYRTVFETLPEAIVLFSLDARYREANRRALELLGYTAQELSQLPLRELIIPEHRIRAYRAFHTLKRKRAASVELNLRRKSGRTVTAAVSSSRLSDGRYAAVIRDVTSDRKADEEARLGVEYLRSMVEGSRYPQVLIMNRRFGAMNAAFQQTYPWVHEGGSNLSAFFGRQNSEFVHDLTTPLWPAEGTPVSFSREVILNTPDGTARNYEVSVSYVLAGSARAVHLTFVDVSHRIQLMASLEESEKHFRILIDNGLGAVSVVQDDKFTFVNRAFLEMFGYLSSDHVIGQNVAVVVAPRERKSVPEKFQMDLRSSQSIRRVELTGVTNDGRQLAVEVSLERVHLAGIQSLLCHWRDCTLQKKAEVDVRRRTRELDVSEKVLAALHSSIEPGEVMSAGLQAALRWLGFECGGLYVREGGEFVLALQHDIPEAIATKLGRQSATEGFLGFVAKACEPLTLLISDYPPHIPYRSLFEKEGFHAILQLPLVKDGVLQAVLLLCSRRIPEIDEQDASLGEVVGRHFAHALSNAWQIAAVRASEERYHRAVDALEDVVYHAQPNGAMVFVSPQVERLLGHTADEFVRSPDLWRSLCHPDDRAKCSERISAQAQGKDVHAIEYRILPKGKAEYRWLREVIRYRRVDGGAIGELRGVVSDITDLVRTQRALSAAESLSLAMVDYADEGIVLYDSAMKCTVWSSSLERFTGIGREEALGRSAVDGIPGFDPEVLVPMIRKAFAGEVVSDELLFHPASGEREKAFAFRFNCLRGPDGKITGVIGTATERTEVKKLQQEARESEDTLRNLIDAMGDALLISDLQGRIWDVNKEFLNLTGYTRSEVLGASFPYPWLLDEEMARFVVWIAALREKKFLRDFDMTWRRNDGYTLAISLNTTLLRNAAGEPVAMLNIARDISERKRLANELAAKNRQIEMLNRIISKANSTVDFEDIFGSIASEVQSLLPFDQISVALLSDDRQSMKIHACISTSSAPLPIGSIVPLYRTAWRIAVQQEEAQVFSSLASHPELGADTVSESQGLKSEICIPITLKDRVLGTLNVGSTAEHAFTGTELTYLQPITDQIGALIDRTQLFERVSDDSTYIHNLLNSIESVVYTVDPGYRIREANKAWKAFAMLQGLDNLSDEASLIGRRIDEVILTPSLWNELKAAMPQLFARDLDIFSRDLELARDGGKWVFHLVVSPMVINDRVTGLVFTFTDITEIKQREAEIRRRNRELIALNAISTSISQSLNYDDVLDIAAEGTLEIAGAKAVLCYLWNEATQEPVILRHPGMPATMAAQLGRGQDSAHLARAVITGRTPMFISRSLDSESRLSQKEHSSFKSLGVRSVACLPLTSKDRVRGSLLVAFAGEHEFTEQEEKFLELIANNIASAIENAQLYAEVQGQVRVVTSLYELGKRLTGALDRKSVLDVLSQEVRKSIPFSLFAYDAVIGEEQSLERVFRTGESAVSEDSLSQALPATACETVLVHHQAYLGNANGDQSLMAVPVRSEKRITGVLSVITAEGTDGQAHLRLLESIANLAGIALDRAALYDDTVTKSIEIQQRNRELDDFTYVVSHDLKEPLITIEGYSKIVLKDYEQHLDQQGKEFLSAVVQSTARMKSLIDDLLVLSRVGRAAESQEPVDVNALLQDVLRDFEFTLREKNAAIVIPPSVPTVQYNPTQLGMVFRNLIGNAIKFNDKPLPRVVVDVTEGEQEYTFSVADNGIGIEAQHYEKIFVIFQRLYRTDQYQGTGAGLTIVKKIVENHHGRVWLESTVGKGTTFYFTIPK
jgi:PAS domain S-box-containing protein